MASQLAVWGLATFTSPKHEAAGMAHGPACSTMARFFSAPKRNFKKFLNDFEAAALLSLTAWRHMEKR